MTLASQPITAHALGPNDWITEALASSNQGEKGVLVFVVRHYGSTPRDKGSWIYVRSDHLFGTLGGGEVERVVEAAAHDMLAGRRIWERVYEKFMLGPDMGQCCGGGMEVVFEPVDNTSINWLADAMNCVNQHQAGFVVVAWNDTLQAPVVHRSEASEILSEAGGVHIQSLIDLRPSVVIYGAGHVARAFAAIAAQLPIRLVIVDERQNELNLVPIAPNIVPVFMEYPPAHAAQLDANTAAVLVMTYSHALDYRLCLSLLKNVELNYVGLIGSKSKGARFRRRFELDEGFSAAQISRLVSPIGQGSVGGKEPGLIALATLNEVMSVLEGTVLMGKPLRVKNF
jgi:xanthine dehydrogenase accessory factor